MNVIINERFEKESLKLKNKKLQAEIADFVEFVQEAESIEKIGGLKRLKGVKAYRLRLGDYRIGVLLEGDDTIEFISVAHRKEFYRSFP